jgi:tetratricopeptide (TPR) repeat protein
MNNFRWVTAFLFVGIVGASSANLSAQNRNGQTSSGEADGSNVENVINEAIELFRAGRYRLSIEKFQEAYELVEDPNILFNIARCYHLLGEKKNAIEFYNRFIYYPDVPADSKERAKKYLEELREGQEGGGGETPQPTGSEASGDNTEGDQSESDAFGQQNGPTDEAKSTPKVLEWSLIGAGLAIAVTGGALGGVALGNHKSFESSHDFDDKADLENKGRVLALASDICLGVGIATAAAGVILMVVRAHKGKKSSSEQQVYAPLMTPGGAGMSWTLQF